MYLVNDCGCDLCVAFGGEDPLAGEFDPPASRPDPTPGPAATTSFAVAMFARMAAVGATGDALRALRQVEFRAQDDLARVAPHLLPVLSAKALRKVHEIQMRVAGRAA